MRLLPHVYMVGSGNFGLSCFADSHVYLVDAGRSLVLIDAGSGIQTDRILQHIREEGFDPANISLMINTHSDWDHARGDWNVKNATGCKIAIHEVGAKIIEETLWPEVYLTRQGVKSLPVKADLLLRDGQILEVGNCSFTVFHTPGHTEDCICLLLHVDGKKVLFSGDTVLGEGLMGPVSAKCNFLAYQRSVSKLLPLEPDVLLPGHRLIALDGASAHVRLLDKKLSGKWTDFVMWPAPFFPSWWVQNNASLVEDARFESPED